MIITLASVPFFRLWFTSHLEAIGLHAEIMLEHLTTLFVRVQVGPVGVSLRIGRDA